MKKTVEGYIQHLDQWDTKIILAEGEPGDQPKNTIVFHLGYGKHPYKLNDLVSWTEKTTDSGQLIVASISKR